MHKTVEVSDYVRVLELTENFCLAQLLFVAGAIFLLVAVTRLKRAWALPVASLFLVFVFYAVAAFKQMDQASLIGSGSATLRATGPSMMHSPPAISSTS